MAEHLDSKARNAAFLKALEIQRLKRPSSYALDLRGKVAGECQAYSIAGTTHYLDDRGYLLVKQLMARFNGQYTIGVQEAVLKAIKTLPRKDEGPTIKVKQTILSRDDSLVQLIALDQSFRRKESRITFSTPVEIRLGDMLYNGITLDISAVAIRVNLKRVSTLEKGDTISVTFPELAPASESRLLANINYSILKIQHDDRRSQLILNLEDDSPELLAWWHAWVDKQQAPSKFDVDHQLLNVVSNVYQRLYNQNINKALLWLSDDLADDPVKVIHLSHFAENTIQPLLSHNDSLDLNLLPIKQLLAEASMGYLVIVYQQDDMIQSAIAACDDSQQLKQILLRHEQQQGHLFFLQAHPQQIDLQQFEQQLNDVASINQAYESSLRQTLSSVTTLITITDIGLPCRRLGLVADSALAASSPNTETIPSINLPRPCTLEHHIDRKSQRFLIKTMISFHLANQRFDIKTDDVSETGLSVSIPGRVSVPEGTLVRINFIRWQKQTKKVKLNAIPFNVRRVQYWEGVTTIGLERNVLSCGEKMNTFFATVIEENRNQLALDTQDVLISSKAKIFSSQLPTSLNSTPFFIAKTPSNKRVLQAVATTQSNEAMQDDRLWQTLQVRANAMSDYLKSATDEGQDSVDFGLYCYLDSNGNWLINCEQDFDTATQKSLFLNRALLAERCRFFHCSLSAIKPNISSEQEGDLNQKLAQLRQHSPINVRKIKDVIHSLFAMGELTDITQILASALTDKDNTKLS